MPEWSNGQGLGPCDAGLREFEPRPPQTFFFLFERKKNVYEKERKGGPEGHCFSLSLSVLNFLNSVRRGFSPSQEGSGWPQRGHAGIACKPETGGGR